ncbi:non-ribosomal peptide synthetase [Peristeroidobacter agariperforans]|uniref:non-ribosomal peptide synthetase n=1 Tax=Peristeroidobacter agariperforans TaxID=268404 RepID=UPI00101DA147|nr:non-ribosomal peptide synthetase [Peristeroidobacter agariperforans]
MKDLASSQLLLSPGLLQKLQDFAHQQDASVVEALITGWALLLRLWLEKDEVSLDIAIHSSADVREAGAFLPDTTPMHVVIPRDTSVRNALSAVHAVIEQLRAMGSDDLPAQIVLSSMIPQALFWHEPAQASNHASTDAIPVRMMTVRVACDQQASTTLEYSRAALSKAAVERLTTSAAALLQQMADGHDLTHPDISGHTTAVRELISHRYVDNPAPYRHDHLIHRLFEEQARRTPDAVAVVLDEQSLTYAEIDARADSLAGHLVHAGVRVDQPVAVFMGRSPEMIVALLGILKAGGAYLPLDPGYPAERLKYMLEDAAPTLVLTQHTLRALLPQVDIPVLALDDYLDGDRFDTSLPDRPQSSDSLVYVIYTSGSTGRPKGTAMPHRAMINLIEWHQRVFETLPGSRVAQFAALSFDVAFQEIFSTLCAGGCLVLMNEWIRRDARALMRYLDSQSIQRLFLPPLVLHGLAQYHTATGEIATSLRDIITAGEQLRITPDIRRLFEHLPDCRLHNHYGPTESHVVTAWTANGDPQSWPTLPPIGQPISNTRIYVLDDHRQRVPTGSTGEIYIGGTTVARGYLGKPELTQQRFVPDPFSSNPADRLYKTGDLARWRDGVLEYLGRNDDQVKIRGFRIELGEIETHLCTHELVGEAAVVARTEDRGEKRLVAYVTPRNRTLVSIESLRSHLQTRLPDHMMPHVFVVLDRMPVTPSGKLDRRSLPAPTSEAVVTRPYDPPASDAEIALAAVWSEVLRVEHIGRQDHFFELGGDSLLMVQMLERLRSRALSIDAQCVYERPTLATMAEVMHQDTAANQPPSKVIPAECTEITPQMLTSIEIDPEQIARIVSSVPGGTSNIQDLYPLAPLQEGILFHHLFGGNAADTYVVSVLLSLESSERASAFTIALQRVVDRHSALRTAILWNDLPQPVQVVYRRAIVPVSTIALSSDRDGLEQLVEMMRSDRQPKLNVSRAPLLTLELADDTRSSRCYAILRIHHLACDHESLDTMFDEISTFMAGLEHELEIPAEYKTHIAHSLSANKDGAAEEFFRDKLSGIEEPTTPFGLTDVHADALRIAEASSDLDASLAGRIRMEARKLGVTAATLFHAAWSIVVSRTSGREDVVFGTLLLGRMYGPAGSRHTLGMFMNTLPIRLRLRGLTAETLIKETHAELAQLLSHEQTSLALAQRCSNVDASCPLFGALLNYRHTAKPKNALSAGFRIVSLQEWTNYPVTLSVDDDGTGFSLVAQIDRSIDPQQIIRYTVTAMQSLLDALQESPLIPALSLPIIPDSERRQVVETFNATMAAYPDRKPIHELFEEQVERTPDAVAVVCEKQSLTYAELNRQANGLAHLLRKITQVGDHIVVLMHRSLEMLIAQLAVLKCGGVYVPMDPDLAPQRQKFMLTDCNPQLVLTDRRKAAEMRIEPYQWLDWNAIHAEVEKQPTDNLSLPLNPTPAAYVMYTSGSTGVPKGVVVPHHAVSRLAINNGYAQVEAGDCIPHYSNPTFDASTFEIWCALLNGARVLIVPQAVVLEPAKFGRLLRQQQATLLWMSVGLFNQCERMLVDVFTQLRYLIVGGDRLDPTVIRRVLMRSPPQHFLNAYGPTECTTFSTTYLIDAVEEDAKSIPIGRPISNTQIYILDNQRQPVPLGTVGEIYIGGAGVAQGYLNQAELTTERFVRDPFSTDTNARMYKSGDLGRWRGDGNIDFIGRNDQQIKIRGFRIEPAEIELQLLKHAQVREAVVIAREHVPGEKRLFAYFIAENCKAAPSAAALRTHLKAALPEYMIPGAFVALEQWPLTPNGKLDRRKLPEPPASAHALTEYQPPNGEMEILLAGLWQEIFKSERVGRMDNFFDLGGNSLLAMKLMVRLRSLLMMDVPVRTLFQFANVAELSAELERMRRASVTTALAHAGSAADALLHDVSTMSESDVRRRLDELQAMELQGDQLSLQ